METSVEAWTHMEVIKHMSLRLESITPPDLAIAGSWLYRWGENFAQAYRTILLVWHGQAVKLDWQCCMMNWLLQDCWRNICEAMIPCTGPGGLICWDLGSLRSLFGVGEDLQDERPRAARYLASRKEENSAFQGTSPCHQTLLIDGTRNMRADEADCQLAVIGPLPLGVSSE